KELDDLLKNQAFKQDFDHFCQSILNLLSQSVSAFRAVFFTYNSVQDALILKATYGVLAAQIDPQQFRLKEGLIGQAALEQEIIHFKHLDPSKKVFEFSSIKVSASDILILPLVFHGNSLGVIEFTFFKPISELKIDYLKAAAKNIAATLEGLLSAQISQDLFNQTQEKKEALEAKEELRRTLEELEATHTLLEEKNRELDEAFEQYKSDHRRLLSSINYAKRMQQAILPSPAKLAGFFQDCFLIYEPKDVVSGDFYWYDQVDDAHYLAVVDCTGHGVPGAFMSMIANTLLNQIIIEKRTYPPAEILNQLYHKVHEVLYQDTSANQDGMHLVLCKIQKNDQDFRVVFSGAKSHLYYTQDQQLCKMEGDRKSIGGVWIDHNFSFTEQEINLRVGDILYLMSDGLEDTCNGHRKSYGRKRLEDRLRENMFWPLSQQKELLWKDLMHYKGQADQRDDIKSFQSNSFCFFRGQKPPLLHPRPATLQ
ncbi:MAG: SpoIIE family protein phosphatase, partial [Bacteroidota bacterium]